MPISRSFPKSIEALEQIVDFLDSSVGGGKIDPEIVGMMQLAVEEIFVNMVKYNDSSSNDIRIELDHRADILRIRLTDFDVDRFDPTEAAAVDINMPLSERRAGGLGIHLVKTMMDQIEYEYKDRNSSVTLIKNLNSTGG